MQFKRNPKIMWITVAVLLFALLAIGPSEPPPAWAQPAPDTGLEGGVLALPDSPEAPADAPPDTLAGTHVDIYYNDCTLHNTADCISAARAQLLVDHMDDAWDAYVDYGFRAPDPGDGPPLPVWAFEPLEDGAFGWARSTHVEIDIDRIQTIATDVHLGTPHHELFHKVQHSYPGDEADWVDEGTCRFIEDMVFLDGDADIASRFVGAVGNLLGTPNQSILDASYDAAIFWKYLTEQYGDTSDPYFGAEPQYGIDFLVDFWDEALTHDGVDAVNAALPGGVNFADAFANFLIANYLKRYNVSDVYRYADDPGPAYAYANVDVEYGVEALPLTHNNENVSEWGALYYVGDPPADCPFIQVSLDGDPGDQAFYAVFATRGNDAFYYDHLGFRTFANDFTKILYNDNYDRIVAVAGGHSDPAVYSISMSCQDPALEILEPRQDLFAVVGDPEQPRRMDVLLEISGADGSFLEGIAWDEFQISVGGLLVDAIISGAPIQSQYWLIVHPPTQTVAGDPPWMFDLDVSLAGLSDHEDDAVHYQPLPHFDEVLVIDSSGSMAFPEAYPKITAAQNAAKLYLDELADDDTVGAVQFNTTATPIWPGMATVNNLTRALGKILIEDVETSGWTSIGGGLLEALDQFEDPTNPDVPENPDVIILLSDGMENTSPCWEYGTEPGPGEPYHDCTSGPYVREEVMDSGIPVNTVALGPGSHEDLMERIAEDTHGSYRFASLPDSLAAQATAALPAEPGLAPPSGVIQPTLQDNQWAYLLVGIYDYFEGEVEGRERIDFEEMTISDDKGGFYESSFFIDQSVSQATFSIAYDTDSTLNGDCTTLRHVQLVEPDETIHTPTYSDDYHDVFEISSPAPGDWTVRVEMFYELCATGVTAPALAPYHYLVIASGQTQLATKVRVGTPHAERFIGLCVPLFATLFGESGPVENGSLTAEVTTPSGGVIPISLGDDGKHGDGAAGDGIYAGRFCRSSLFGSYTVEVRGQIEALQGTIRRLSEASFYVQADKDTDNDELPNHWELEHGTNPGMADDTGNPDWDFACIIGCGAWDNTAEYAYGTDPNSDDSDGGGEMDASELLNNQDPSGGPEDDGVETPTSLEVTPGNGENVITYDVRPGDSAYWLFWSTDPQMGDMLDHHIDIGTTGIYSHTGLTNDTMYYYLLVARRDTHISGFPNQAAAKPALDAVPPWSEVLINEDAPRATSLDVTLSLFTSEDTVEMLISNTPDFEGAEWEAFSDTRAWRIVPTPEGAAFVYVRYRDAAGNASLTAVDGILPPLPVENLYLPMVIN